MKKHISYPKIGAFRHIVSNINRHSTFVGLDENGDAIYDNTLEKPTLTFKGTVKLHGTNASVCFNSKEGFWVQSRQNIITIQKDNAGFAFFTESNKIELCSLLNKIINEHQIDTNIYTVSIYGEWAGGNIQKNVGIGQLEKAFYIFGVKISNPNDEDFNSYWVDSSKISFPEKRIFNIEDFQTYSIDVDFNTPQLSQNKFIEITEKVEAECPVAKHFGVGNGIGEGVVWTTEYKGNVYRFKEKGQKHSVTKVKKSAKIDTEKLNSIQEFIEYSVTKNRFDQGITIIFDGDELDVKKLGDFIRWMINDITSEEMDTMSDNKLEPKDVNKYISNKIRTMFFEEMKNF